MFEAYKKFFNLVQGRTITVKEHLTNFMNRVEVIESIGGSFSLEPGMLHYVLNGKKENRSPGGQGKDACSKLHDDSRLWTFRKVH